MKAVWRIEGKLPNSNTCLQCGCIAPVKRDSEPPNCCKWLPTRWNLTGECSSVQSSSWVLSHKWSIYFSFSLVMEYSVYLILIWIWYVAKIHIIIWIYFKMSFCPLYMWSLNKGMKVILQLYAFSSVSFHEIPERLRLNKAIGCCPLKDIYRNNSLEWMHCQRYLWVVLTGCCSVPFPSISSP